jgi:glyoxylase-like metal-dependent hydrolase (beta-lactamase superfamily II)
MRLHHLNCISSCPMGGHLMDGRSSSILERGRLCCHCVLAETSAGLVLIDTGMGLNDVRSPRSRLSSFFLALMSPDFREDMTAVRQIESLGFSARDVRHIVLTHLDFDHAGGLDDFPEATVHMLGLERQHAEAQQTWLDRQRFRPQQWGDRSRWITYEPDGGEPWFGFARARPLQGLPPEIALVPLIGHTHGHAGVALDLGEHWFMQAGDAYFWAEEMNPDRPYCTPGLRMYQWMMEKNRRARVDNQRRLRELVRQQGANVQLCCGHDPIEFERVAGRPMSVPAGAMGAVRT